MTPEYGSRELQAGLSGDDVRELQIRIIAFGSLGAAVPCDGVFSASTGKAVKKFREKVGLPASEIADSQMFQAIDTWADQIRVSMAGFLNQYKCNHNTVTGHPDNDSVLHVTHCNTLWTSKVAGRLLKTDNTLAGSSTTCAGFGNGLNKVALTSSNSYTYTSDYNITENPGLDRLLFWLFAGVLKIYNKTLADASITNGYRCQWKYFFINAHHGNASLANHTGHAIDFVLTGVVARPDPTKGNLTQVIWGDTGPAKASRATHADEVREDLKAYGCIENVHDATPNRPRTEQGVRWVHLDTTTYANHQYVTTLNDAIGPKASATTSSAAANTTELQPVRSFVFPAKIAGISDNRVTSETVEKHFHHTEKTNIWGGWFPLGANTLWHGGVHLHVSQRSDVVAMADGEIVAAKLAESEDKAIGHYGSHNFILMRHVITGKKLNAQFPPAGTGAAPAPGSFNESDEKVFYSLYMHLKNEVLDQGANAKLKQIKWLPRAGGGSAEDHKIPRGETLEALATRWTTTVDEIRAANQEVDSHYGSSGGESWYRAGDTVERPIDRSILDSLRTGEVVKVQGARVNAGDLLWTSGMYGTDTVFRSGGVLHWEVFSEENLFPSFTAVEDSDENWTMDSQTIFGMVDQMVPVLPGEWSNLDGIEVKNFYKNNENAHKLREYACKFISEWAVDVDRGIEDMKGIRSWIASKDKLEPYQWWSKAAQKGVTLPSAKVHWHYNPISFVYRLSVSESVTTISQSGIELLQQVESLRLQPYNDQNGQTITSWVQGATIGYGHLIHQNEWNLWSGGITEAQAEQMFMDDLAPFVNAVNDNVNISLTQNQFDALVIFAYNIGVSGFAGSSAVKLVNDPNASTSYDSLEDAWKAWNKSQGQVMQGLINRRNAEWKMYSEGVYEAW